MPAKTFASDPPRQMDVGGRDQHRAQVFEVEAVIPMCGFYGPEGWMGSFLGTHDSNRMASRAAFDPAQGCRWPDGGGCASLPADPSDPARGTHPGQAIQNFNLMFGLPETAGLEQEPLFP